MRRSYLAGQSRRFSMKMVFAPNLKFVTTCPGYACSSSDRLFLQFDIGSKASIFVRKTLSVRPEKSEKAKPFTSSMEGPAFFDEDDACAKSKVRDSLSELLPYITPQP